MSNKGVECRPEKGILVYMWASMPANPGKIGSNRVFWFSFENDVEDA